MLQVRRLSCFFFIVYLVNYYFEVSFSLKIILRKKLLQNDSLTTEDFISDEKRAFPVEHFVLP